MDDFGNGQSSLKQLIGLRWISSDRQVADRPAVEDQTADRLLRGVVALAAALRVKVIAEGVETASKLSSPGCGVDAVRGGYGARPFHPKSWSS
jgi:cyclic di-GMP phosphodiesterase Gmr